MAYRQDPDLEILARASNEDLLLLADTLMFKDDKHRRKKSYRWAATLYLDNNFETCYPNNLHNMWKAIGEEMQKYGGHTGVNLIFRGNKGVLYREMLIDVCKSFKIKNIDYKNSSTYTIEDAFLQKVIEVAINKMSESEKRELLDGLKTVEGFKEQIKNNLTSTENLFAITAIAFKSGGFNSYILILKIVNSISRGIWGKGLTLAANATIAHYLKVVSSRLLGWQFFIASTLWSFMGPNKDVVLKSVTIVAYIRRNIYLNAKY